MKLKTPVSVCNTLYCPPAISNHSPRLEKIRIAFLLNFKIGYLIRFLKKGVNSEYLMHSIV